MNLYESETVELKEIFVSDIKKEVVAFVNSRGGTIYVGVRDNGEIVGLDQPDFVMQQLSNTLRDGIRPDVSMFTDIELLQEETHFLVRITVRQGTQKPYYLPDKGLKPSGVYVRSGTSSVPASEEAIRRMIKLTDGDSFEKNRSYLQELTFHRLSDEMQRRNLDFTEVQMKNLGIVLADELYTNLGLLLSDQCKHSIRFAIFQGTDKLVFKDRKEFTGSLLAQLTEAYQMIDFYNATRATFQDLLRSDERDYPQEAVREALLNAIVHREYALSGSTFINIFSNRLEIVSLGGLVPGLSMEAAMLGASQPRNEKLANLFYRMKLIEAYGTGLSKILSCYNGLPMQPKFESVEGAFRVTLPNIHAQSEAAESKKYLAVLKLLEHGREITRLDVEKTLHIGTTHAVNLLKEMQEKELIEKLGGGRQTRYIAK